MWSRLGHSGATAIVTAIAFAMAIANAIANATESGNHMDSNGFSWILMASNDSDGCLWFLIDSVGFYNDCNGF